ncbi:hypothetical protein COCMIDRAFT_102392 [Bipolaris oryzae ATCC 44560]|uniref:Uncharacterized protein n=1 Tax=Bipolaris oryzae ATCC 44560 TaxID=930090 RepID=W6YZ29_COCMI|nr:uncharacterized protein COCMIDRAFT_102392 [Bipolaris oryzae ATCC 44560]EUC42840.1 hypothetical protein COCMIDRAFT_102392 [Bipolaris oryzae ATCC 44560]
MCLFPQVILCPRHPLPLAAQGVIRLLFMHIPCASNTNHFRRKKQITEPAIHSCTPTFVFMTPTRQVLLLYCTPALPSPQPSKPWRQGRNSWTSFVFANICQTAHGPHCLCACACRPWSRR